MAAQAYVPVTFRALLVETLQAENYPDNAPHLGEFLTVYTGLRDNFRAYFINEEVVSAQVWRPFRENEPAMDLLLRLAMSFHLRLVEADMGERFKRAMADALLVNGGEAGKGYTDADFASKVVDVRTANAMPNWLSFLVYAFMEPVVVLAVYQNRPAPKTVEG